MRRSVAVVAVLALATATLPADDRSGDDGAGLAAKYPGDAGLERDPSVLLVERFEDDIPSIKKRWTEVVDKDGNVPDDPVNVKTSSVWFDDVVVATKRVGPRRGK